MYSNLWEQQSRFPAEVDGKTFRIDFSRQVMLSYNIEGKKNIGLTEIKAPEISVPQGVDVDALYASLVELPVLPENMQKQLKSIKDWKSTLYIPVMEKDTRVSRGSMAARAFYQPGTEPK